jgi:hypothetical protein
MREGFITLQKLRKGLGGIFLKCQLRHAQKLTEKNTRNCQTIVVWYNHNLLEREKMTDQQLVDKIVDLFDAVIDESALDRLSEEELKAIDKILTEAGY